jgi:hypothetical protein
MLMQEFSDAVRRVREKHSQFLMVGGNQYAFESWEQGLAAAVTRTSCAERTAARAGMD